MATTRIKEKISALVSSQLPDFVQSDFPTFVAFIEAYYRFLEQDQGASELIQNARSYNDIDRTTDSFVQYFLDTYAKNTPKNLLLDDRFLVKKIKDLYEAKGSELSFKLLFRTLFNTNVEVRVPYENVLRASGGGWQQNFSIRVETVTGNRNDLTNRFITHTSGGVIFQTPIVRTKILTSTLTEIFLDANFLSSSYSTGDLIEVFEGTTLVFSGTISPTTVSFRIDQAGTGFKVGQIFNISAGGIDTLIKVTKVSSTGGLENIKIISYGYGYLGESGSNILTVILDKDSNVSFRENFYNSQTGGLGSNGLILKSDLSSPERYFLEDYTDDAFYTITSIAGSFNNDAFLPQITSEGGSVTSNLAVIVFTLGALARYPGSYYTDQSFLSESEVRLQDDQLYQPFAYQTVTDVDITSFVDIVKKLLNPAGQALFNNRTLNQDLDLSSSVALESERKILFNIHDFTKYTDDFLREVNTFKDSIGVLDSIIDYNFGKFETDGVSIVESSFYELDREFDESVTIDDPFTIGLLFFRSFEEDRSKDYFLEEYTDLGDYVQQTGVVFDDNQFISTTKNIPGDEDTVSITDNSILVEFFNQDYVEDGYFVSPGPLYVGTLTSYFAVNPITFEPQSNIFMQEGDITANVFTIDYYDPTYSQSNPIYTGTLTQSIDIS